MAINVVDLVKIKALTTGTGAIALGDAVPGYRGIEGLTNGQEYSYSIQQGSEFEVGRGTYLSATVQLTRSPLYSSNGGAALELQPNAMVAFVLLSSDLAQIKEGAPGAAGPPGPAGNVAADLDALKAAPITNRTMLYDQATFNWAEGDYSDTPEDQLDVNVVESDSTSLATGAWVRQFGSKIQLAGGASVQSFVDTVQSTEGAEAVGTPEGNAQEALDARAKIADLLASSGAGTIGWIQSLDEAISRLVSAKLAERVSVLDFGADPTGVDDSSDAFTAALAASIHVRVTPGTYRLDSKITVPIGYMLELDSGVILQRTTDSSSTDPVIHLSGSGSGLKGKNWRKCQIKTANAAPKGIVCIGPLDYTQAASTAAGTVTYCVLEGVEIQGMQAYGQTSGNPDICIYVPCYDPTKGNYYHMISRVRVTQANNGYWGQGDANGIHIKGMQGYQIGNSGVAKGALIRLSGSKDNQFEGLFLAQSSGTSCVILENSTGSVAQLCQSNYIQGACEQGGVAKGLEAISPDSETMLGNIINLVDNASGGNTMSSKFKALNTVTLRSSSIVRAIDHGKRQLRSATAATTTEFAVNLSGLTENTAYKLATIALGAGNGAHCVVELFAGATNDTAAQAGPIYARLLIRRFGATIVTVKRHEAETSTETGPRMAVPGNSAGIITLGIMLGNSGGSITTGTAWATIRVTSADVGGLTITSFDGNPQVISGGSAASLV